MLLTVLGPAVSILIYLQMFNWFSRWAVPIVLGYLYSLKAASYIVTIWLAKANYNWEKFAVCAVLMAVATILDIFWFNFYPMEVGIFVDLSERSKEDQSLIQRVQTYLVNHPDQKLTFLELFYRQKDTDTGNKKISLSQPFYYQGTYILIISATMRHVSLWCNLNYKSLITA